MLARELRVTDKDSQIGRERTFARCASERERRIRAQAKKKDSFSIVLYKTDDGGSGDLGVRRGKE
jgi:hypothetical protein